MVSRSRSGGSLNFRRTLAVAGILGWAGLFCPEKLPAGDPAVFEVRFEQPGYRPGQSVVMQGETLTRWIGHNGRSFLVEAWPRPGAPGNRGLTARLNEPGRRIALFEPSDSDFGHPAQRHAPHVTEFTLQVDKDWINARSDPSGGVNHLSLYLGGMAVRLVAAMNTLQALVYWPGEVTPSLGKITLVPDQPISVRVVCRERMEYRVELDGGRRVGWSVRRGESVETQNFDGLISRQPYTENRVIGHWMNPEWDCIPEIRLETNNFGGKQGGVVRVDDLRFAIFPGNK